MQRRPDDDVAEVIGAGDRRGDHRKGERGALVGAGEVDLAGQVDWVGACAGAECRRCRPGWRRGSSGLPPLRDRSSWVRRRPRGRHRAVGIPARVAEKPGGVVTVRPVRFWSPSFRVRSIEKGVWAPAVLSATPSLQGGVERRVVPGQGDRSDPSRAVKYWVEVCSGSESPRA